MLGSSRPCDQSSLCVLVSSYENASVESRAHIPTSIPYCLPECRGPNVGHTAGSCRCVALVYLWGWDRALTPRHNDGQAHLCIRHPCVRCRSDRNPHPQFAVLPKPSTDLTLGSMARWDHSCSLETRSGPLGLPCVPC